MACNCVHRVRSLYKTIVDEASDVATSVDECRRRTVAQHEMAETMANILGAGLALGGGGGGKHPFKKTPYRRYVRAVYGVTITGVVGGIAKCRVAADERAKNVERLRRRLDEMQRLVDSLQCVHIRRVTATPTADDDDESDEEKCSQVIEIE